MPFIRDSIANKKSILKHIGIYGTLFLLDMTFGHESTRGWAVSIPSCPKLFQILKMTQTQCNCAKVLAIYDKQVQAVVRQE